MAAWVACKGFLLLAGVLMIVVGVRRSGKGVCIGAFLLLVALSVVQYFTAVYWARDLEEIDRHEMSRLNQSPSE
jgi:membrane-bound ClpP family serine protease